VLAFPGVFRGMLDVSAEAFTEEMALAAAQAIAAVVGDDKLNPTVIVPSVFDPRVTPAVAAAIRAVVRGGPVPVNASAVPAQEMNEAPESTF
jgi:malate dehydrogenase (oxaloacetate-decarboxylating)